MNKLKMTRLLLILFLCANISSYAQESSTFDDKHFVEYLTNSLKNNDVNIENKNAFLKASRNYWNDRKLDYNLHPENYEKAISLFHENQEKFKGIERAANNKSNNRIENAVKNFQNLDDRNTFSKNSILFVGSSSIAGWKTSISFPEFYIINRGIGGMNMTEIIQHYEILIKKHAPSVIVIYCDIDIEQGKSPEIAVNAFKELIRKIKEDLPKTSILLLSMKPVMIDDFIGRNIRKNKMITNELLLEFSEKENNIQFVDLASPMLHIDGKLKTEIFINDGMHLNKLGYEIWNPIIRNILLELTK
ncbi:GDSL-type esterase/lipase family protein [Polaribacter sp. Z014]|uniref:GDSL-type esterase/lipase family protein n=1 Tax=Polaribacter sp. Z014 TaxID=2927126 RepID=UPI002021A080|nr:GDSL-type esterase/lipase family protein [Polaribacter sp. Z014]MCL7763415.1 GDSL-type esterase/lipase family protein [Polaribacter sp. Z014]